MGSNRNTFTGTGPFTMTEAYGQLWGKADTAFCAYKKFSGNGSITVKVNTADAASAGVNLKKVKAITIGVGNKTAPVKTGTGKLYIDDLEFGRSLQ